MAQKLNDIWRKKTTKWAAYAPASAVNYDFNLFLIVFWMFSK